jgi:hypothetical protein
MNKIPPIPFTRSYWAVPGKLLAGCYPGDINPKSMEARIEGLVRCGVTLVVNLMEEDETDHIGRPFLPYLPLLLKKSQAAGRVSGMKRHAIVDMSIPTIPGMQDILKTIQAEISHGGTVYVHCWGGKGRTGTVVGCYLQAHGTETAGSVLQTLKKLTAHASESFWPTPQTQEQSSFVLNWMKESV